MAQARSRARPTESNRAREIAAGSPPTERLCGRMPVVAGDRVPPRRRRRRAVWRAGEGISRPGDAGARRPGTGTGTGTEERTATPIPAPPVPAPPDVARAATPEADDAAAEARPPNKRRRSDPSERGLRDLVGAGPSQLGPVRAMRARDANRPTADDLAEAEQDVVIVRRHWKPPT